MEFDCLDVASLTGFDWDEGNRYKNSDAHGLDYRRIEEVFFNEPLLVMEDFTHSDAECRCFAYGHDDRGTRIMVVFTTRNDRIRVISARTMTPKEKAYYEANRYNPWI